MTSWQIEERKDRIIVALDLPATDAIAVAENLVGHAKWLKVGMTLYYETGPAIIRQLHKLGYKVFVDLKLHDIPHQVEGAAFSLAKAGADMISVHASGGSEMLKHAMCGAQKIEQENPQDLKAPIVCAISVLTSLNEETLCSIGVRHTPLEQVKHLAHLASDAGVSALVCSAQEAPFVREILGQDAIIVTPGVRPKGANLDDQSRVATPKEAFDNGASHIVIGRPIVKTNCPAQNFDEISRTL